jgi:hypothetical protein
MALSPEIDNQEILGVLIGRLRPAAAWKSCTDLATLTATWEDQTQTVPSEQEFNDEYVLYLADIAAAEAEQEAESAAATRFQNARADFRALIQILGPAFDTLSPQQRVTQIANFGNLQGLNDSQFRNAMGFALALYSIGLDYIDRRERDG